MGGGRKLQQTKDAMTTMLDKMSEKNIDNFNIILFDGSIDVWGRKRCGQNVDEDLNEYDYLSDYGNLMDHGVMKMTKYLTASQTIWETLDQLMTLCWIYKLKAQQISMMPL